MFLPDLVAFSAFKDSIKGVATLVITELPTDTKELITTLNTLAVMYKTITLGAITLHNNSLILRKEAVDNATSTLTLTSSELLEKLAGVSINITTTHKTARNTTNGLLYSPAFNGPIFYDKYKGTVLNASTEVITGDMKKLVLAGAESLYIKHLKDFMPAVNLLEAHKAKLVKEARKLQASRGFTSAPSVGDTVKILPYADMVTRYGEDTTSAPVAFVKAQFPSYGVPFIKPLAYLADQEFTIGKIDNATGVVVLRGSDGALLNINEIEIDGDTHQLSPSPIFHEQMLLKI